jgi:hypothetical protein
MIVVLSFGNGRVSGLVNLEKSCPGVFRVARALCQAQFLVELLVVQKENDGHQTRDMLEIDFGSILVNSPCFKLVERDWARPTSDFDTNVCVIFA